MSITDELREYVGNFYLFRYKDVREKLGAIADRIDETYKKAVRELNGYASDSVLLPRDGDGEIIRVGDMMEYGKTRGRVIALMLSNYPKKWGGGLHWAIQLEGEKAPTALDAFFHHYREPTVEDVLREMVAAYMDTPLDNSNDGEFFAQYAAKLQLVESDDQ